MKWIEIDQDYLRTETAVYHITFLVRLMSISSDFLYSVLSVFHFNHLCVFAFVQLPDRWHMICTLCQTTLVRHLVATTRQLQRTLILDNGIISMTNG